MKNSDQIFQKAFKLVNQLSFTDPTHQIDHSIRVVRLAEYLADKEGFITQIDLESLKLAAIFHDLGSNHRIKKLRRNSDKTTSEKHAEYGAKIAQKFLKEEGVSKVQIKKIQQIINSHGSDGLKGNIEGDLLHDADLLDGLGLAGILRIFTFGGQINRGVLDSLEFIKIKLQNRQPRTKTGQEINKKRLQKVLRWIKEVEKELQGQDLDISPKK